ncbi:MAG: hypothetical protein JNM07_05810 [Phycisphaerae bacterium]|nr:hypothetical protein [Phycisphaerae bacterium]
MKCIACIVLLALSLEQSAMAQLNFSFARVVDTSMTIPGTQTQTFGGQNAFSSISMSDGGLAFYGTSKAGWFGVYEYARGGLSVIADRTTSVPGTSSPFTALGYVVARNGDALFVGGNQQRGGIYSRFAGSLGILADSQTPLPDGSGSFVGYGSSRPQLESGNAVFFDFEKPSTSPGVFRTTNGALSIVADTRVPLPNGSGNYSRVVDWKIQNDSVYFAGAGSGVQTGLWRKTGNTITTLADQNTQAPDGLGKFVFYDYFGANSTSVVVRAQTRTDGGATALGLFRITGDTITRVADINPTMNVANITTFGGVTVFYDQGQSPAIYAVMDGQPVQRVLAQGDTLDGKLVTNVGMSPNSRDANQFAIWVRFADDNPFVPNQAIYVVTAVPEGGALTAAATLLAAAAARRRRA